MFKNYDCNEFLDARAHLNTTAAVDCDSAETLRIASSRVTMEINHTMQVGSDTTLV